MVVFYLATVFFGADALPPAFGALAVVAFGALGAAGFFSALGLAGALVALAAAAGALPAVLPPAFGAGVSTTGAGSSTFTGSLTTGATSTLYGASGVADEPLSFKKNHQPAKPITAKPITISIFLSPKHIFTSGIRKAYFLPKKLNKMTQYFIINTLCTQLAND